MRDLTGAPGIYKDIKTTAIFDYLMECKKKKYLMTCSSNKSTGFNGIVSEHAYAILDVRKVSVGSKIILIRNPWGTVEWTGDWSSKSAKCTNKLKKEVKFNNSNDGSFWMNIKDFVRKFTTVGICKIHEGYLYNSIKYDNNPLTEKCT